MDGLKQRSWIILPVLAGVVALTLIATRTQTGSFAATFPGVARGIQDASVGDDSQRDWTMEGLNPARTRSREQPIAQPFTQQRAVVIPGDAGEGSPPAIVDNTLLVEAPDDVRAVDLITGKQRWRVALPGTYISPAVADGRVFVRSEASNKGQLLALDLKNGSQLWSFTPKQLSNSATNYVGGHLTSPLVVDGRIIVGAGSDVYALDATTGQGLWNYPTQELVTSSATVLDGQIYIADFTHMYALDFATGKELWRYPTKSSISFAPIASGQSVFVTNGDNLVALDHATGKERWSTHYPNVELVPGAASESLVYLKSTTDLYAIDATTGKEAWRFHNLNFVSLPAIAGNDLFVVSGNGPDSALESINAQTGKRNWRMPYKGLTNTAPVIAGQTIYVRSGDGRVIGFWR